MYDKSVGRLDVAVYYKMQNYNHLEQNQKIIVNCYCLLYAVFKLIGSVTGEE